MLDKVPGEVAHPEQYSTERKSRRPYASAASDTDLQKVLFAESVSLPGSSPG